MIPHQVVINVRFEAEVYEQLSSGQVSGQVKQRLTDSKLYTILGDSVEDCLIKAKELISKLKREGETENGSISRQN